MDGDGDRAKPAATRVGRRLREQRETAGLSMLTLAKRSGVSKGWVWQVETGLLPHPGIDKLTAVAGQLGCTADELYGRGRAELRPDLAAVLQQIEEAGVPDETIRRIAAFVRFEIEEHRRRPR